MTDKRDALLIIFTIFLAAASVGYVATGGPLPGISIGTGPAISLGSQEKICNYQLSKDGSTYLANDGHTGENRQSSTDGDTIIQWALDQSDGFVICFKNEFTVDNTINIPSNRRLTGFGIKSVINATSTAQDPIMQNKNFGTATKDTDIEIDNLYLDTRLQTTAKALRTANLEGFKFHDLTVDANNAITIQDSSSKGSIYNNRVNHPGTNPPGGTRWISLVSLLAGYISPVGMPSDISIFNNIVVSWDDCIWIQGGNRVKVYNNFCHSIAGSQPINLETQAATLQNSTLSNIEVVENTVRADALTGGSPRGIKVLPVNQVGNVNNIRIEGNLIIGNNKIFNGISISQPIGFDYAIENIMVAGNIVNRTTSVGVSIGFEATRGKSRNFIVSENKVSFSSFEGFEFIKLENSLVQGNIAFGNSQAGGVNRAGFVFATVLNNTITDNRAVDYQSTRTQYIGFTIGGSPGSTGNLIMSNLAWGNVNAQFNIVAGSESNTYRDNLGYVTENWGGTSVADGGTISHGLAGTPDSVTVTCSVASQMCSVTALAATTFTVAIKTDTGAAGTTQTVYWYAVFIP